MSTSAIEPIADTPDAALKRYIAELRDVYSAWYYRATLIHSWAWGIGQTVAIVASLLAALVAGLTTKESFGWISRTLLVALPLIATFASSLVLQTKSRELLSLRERGRERIQALVSKAEADYAGANGNEVRMTEIHRALVDAVSQLEREQSVEFFTVAPGGNHKG